MRIFNASQTNEIAQLLKSGKIGIMPTDTIYGIHCLANDPNLVDKIYQIKKRPDKIPLITIISNLDDLLPFEVELNDYSHEQISRFWPGPNTLIFDTNQNETRSFRMPDNDFLLSILKITGPLISTSANLHGQQPAKDVNDAIKYFADSIDFYVDGGKMDNPPSNVYRINQDTIDKIR